MYLSHHFEGTESWQKTPQPLDSNHVTQKRRHIYRMIIALTQNWLDLLLGVDEEDLKLSSCTTVRCIITDCELGPDLTTRCHLWKSPTSRWGKLNSRCIQFLQKVLLYRCCRNWCTYFCTSLLCRVCVTAIYFSGLWIGQAQSGFNHKTPWPHARTEWGKLLVYLWRPYKHRHRCTVKQILTLFCRERRASSFRTGSQRNGSKKVHVLELSFI